MLYWVISGVFESPLPTPGDAGVHPGEVLLAQAGGQRRTDVQALTRDGTAVYAFSEAGIRAGCRGNRGAGNCRSLEVEEGRGDAVCRRQCGKRRGGEPLVAGRLYGLALSLVGEEGKDPVLPDRSTDASTQLVITVLIPEQATLGGCQLGSGDWINRLHRLGAVPTLISIQSRTNDLDEKAAVKIVGSALGGNFGQRPRETAIFSVVGIGDDFNVGRPNLDWG